MKISADRLSQRDIDYLSAAADDPEQLNALRMAGSIHITIGSNPEDNLWMHGSTDLGQLLKDAQSLNYHHIFVMPSDNRRLHLRDERCTYQLPYQIKVHTHGPSASIESGLRAVLADTQGADDDILDAVSDTMEAFLLALASNGVNLDDPKIHKSLSDALDATMNHITQ